MGGLYEWIMEGKGRGKRYLLALAILFSGLSSFFVYSSWSDLISNDATSSLIQSLPDMQVENGTLVKPVDTYQDILWTVPAADFKTYHLIINTQDKTVPTKDLPLNGVYLTQKDVYLSNDGNITVQALDNLPNFEVKQGQWLVALQRGVVRFSWGLFIGSSIILFVSLYIWSLIYALLSYALTFLIAGENYSFPVRRRLSSASLIIAYVIAVPFAFWGWYSSMMLFFLLVLIIMSFFLAGLPKNLIIPIDND